MMIKAVVVLLCLVALSNAQVLYPASQRQEYSPDNENFVAWWHGVLITFARSAGQSSPVTTRNFAIVSNSIFAALNSINPAYEQLFVVPAPQFIPLDPRAAIVGAGYRSLVSLYPDRFDDLNIVKKTMLGLLGRPREGLFGPVIRNGYFYGIQVADAVLASRADDGSADTVAYTPGTNPGDWQPTSSSVPANAAASDTNWPQVDTWVIETAASFRPAAPPAITSAGFLLDYEETRTGGRQTSFNGVGRRQSLETYAAIHFAHPGAGTAGQVGQFLDIAIDIALTRRLSIMETARFLALTTLTLADSAIASYEAKYFYSAWRPITAITGNSVSGATQEGTWVPLIATESTPSYTEFNAVAAAALSEVWRSFFNGNINFLVRSESLPGLDANYRSFDQFTADVAYSSIFGGNNFRAHIDASIVQGDSIGAYIYDNVFDVLN